MLVILVCEVIYKKLELLIITQKITKEKRHCKSKLILKHRLSLMNGVLPPHI